MSRTVAGQTAEAPTNGQGLAWQLTGRRGHVVFWVVTLAPWIPLIVFPDAVASLANENSLIEWLGTLAFGAAAYLFWLAAWRDDTTARKVSSGILGFIFFVSFMEELSWGQQVFKWNTPPAFEANTQNETNLHNFAIGVFGIDQQQLFTLGVLGLTVVLPLACLWAPARRWTGRLGLPVVPLSASAWVMINLVVANVGERLMDWEAQRGLREYMEAMWGVASLLVAATALQQANRGR